MIITLCGSSKMRDEVYESARLLREAGYIVLQPPLHRLGELLEDQPAETRELVWKGATLAHFERIAKADVVLVVNPSGYVGASTTLEIGYAAALRKLIVSMQPDEEPSRSVLFDVVLDETEVAAAVEALGRRLGWPER